MCFKYKNFEPLKPAQLTFEINLVIGLVMISQNECILGTVQNPETIHEILIINQMTLPAVWLVIGISSVKLCIVLSSH